MNDIPLNHVFENDSGWFCNVFEFDKINVGGLFIGFDTFSEMNVKDCEGINFRIYKKSKKLVVSGLFSPLKTFCALNLSYPMWRCMLCKKISNFTENQCFCDSYSKCWTPLNGEIIGVLFNDKLEFSYHFEKDTFSNLIL